MKRISYILFLLFTLLLVDYTTGGMDEFKRGALTEKISTFEDNDKQDNIDHTASLSDSNDDRRQSAAQMVKDARGLQHVANSRPQRVVPASANKSKRHMAVTVSVAFHDKNKPSIYRTLEHPLSAPFLPQPPCNYYVYALRRLLC